MTANDFWRCFVSICGEYTIRVETSSLTYMVKRINLLSVSLLDTTAPLGKYQRELPTCTAEIYARTISFIHQTKIGRRKDETSVPSHSTLISPVICNQPDTIMHC